MITRAKMLRARAARAVLAWTPPATWRRIPYHHRDRIIAAYMWQFTAPDRPRHP